MKYVDSMYNTGFLHWIIVTVPFIACQAQFVLFILILREKHKIVNACYKPLRFQALDVTGVEACPPHIIQPYKLHHQSLQPEAEPAVGRQA